MKNTKKCSKCGSNDILVVPTSVVKTVSNIIPSGWTMSGCVGLDRFVCGACGFTEEWVTQMNEIEELRSKFPTSKS